MVDIETVEEALELKLLEDYANAAHYTGLVGNNMVSRRQHHIPSGSGHVSSERVQFQVVLAREFLQLLSDHLALHWQTPRGIDNNCECHSL
jgi:hypothetical protein